MMRTPVALAALIFAVAASLVACASKATPPGGEMAASTHPQTPIPVGEKLMLSDDEWKKKLTPEQFRVLREGGTERAWTGALLENKKPGTYRCGGCGAPLFESATKYDSGSGWPSFHTALGGRVEEKVDTGHGMIRTEVLCSRCGGHLGHKFPDGPRPTGERYCINSASLAFESAQSVAPDGTADATKDAAKDAAKDPAKGQ